MGKNKITQGGGEAVPQLNLDCEGPLTLNDNAFELCSTFIPQGDKFFALVSKYDDYLADIEKRPGYKAGDTLKLILPFLSAFEVTNEIVRKFSRKTIKTLPGAIELLQKVQELLPTFIISTSYCPYLEALCEISDFPMTNVFCTDVDFDRYKPTDAEKRFLRELAQEIANLPMIELPKDAKSIMDLSEESQRVIIRLEEIFWKIIPDFKTGRFLEEVNPIGGREKAKALHESLSITGLSADEIIYVGDSITDVEAFELVKEASGGAISFNGNWYALRAAEFYCLAPQAKVLACLARIFMEGGREALLHEAERLEFSDCKRLPQELSRWEEGMSFGLIEREDFEKLVEKSLAMRKKVRGEAIGALG